ncbi:hypothetical protein B0J13DRAFT_501157 [Dactylonectria estremocensis]|uniref:Nephrocystin 3-like N-terminal domain-containing protein n=1 Tax=Dactylonectria estremocensis TaxID=1079267 RepID=A0A9P9ETR8_9HYPO|nr:hypothetical protein B0J13DRAFT_501157 [Dactylonectria estremocensis]
MDPLSLAASITGLVSIADGIFRKTTKYVKSVRRSRQEVAELLGEVKTVSLLLHNLSIVAFELETDPAASEIDDQQSLNIKPHHLHGCQTLLTRLETGLTKASTGLESSSTLKRVNSSLRWPFSSTETKEMLQEMQRHNQTISLALEADSMSSLRKCLSRQEETKNRVKDLQITTKKLLDIETKIYLDEQRRRVLQLFSKSNPRSEFETAKRLRHPLTGLWFADSPEFDEWYNTPNAKIWLSGIPGAGKSIIAGTVINECLQRTKTNPRTAVAYFFCTYRDPKTHVSSTILSSLAAQLAQQSESAYQVLAEYYEELQPEQQLSAEPTVDELLEVICTMCTSYSQVYLIIDGIDECGNRVEASLRDLLSVAMTETHEIVNIAILSRDEAPIRHQLEEYFYCIEMEAHTEDIQLYVASELEARIASKRLRLRSLELKDHIMTRLISGAKGMFRWVACQLDHICELPTDRDRREALERLPPTLPSSYERILMRLEDSSDAVRDLVRKTLQLISVSRVKKLNFKEICEALSVSDVSDTLDDEDMVDRYEVLHWCGSLVRTSDKDEFIEFAHYTVQEYLEQACPAHAKLKAYAISDDKAYHLLGSLCLRYLTLTNFAEVPETYESHLSRVRRRNHLHPFYEYAASHWPYFIQHLSAQSHASPGLEELFRIDKTANFCSWTIQVIDYYFSQMSEASPASSHSEGGFNAAMKIIAAVLTPDFTPLHMAAVLGLPDLCTQLLEQGANLNMRSNFGTPLQCAIASFSIFSKVDCFDVFESVETGSLETEFIPAAARRSTVQLLMKAGADPGLNFSTPFRKSTAVSLPIVSCTRAPDFEIVVDLLMAGVTVEDDDLEHFDAFFQAPFRTPDHIRSNFDGGIVFSKLLGALGGSKMPTSAQSRLYTSTLRFMNRMRLETRGLSAEVLPAYNASGDEVREFVTSIIKKNDVPTLELFLKSSRSELVKVAGLDASDPDPGLNSLHIAIKAGSLDVLDLLLGFGCDPNSQAEDGRTPAQLCYRDEHQDALQILLRHGASTVIPDKKLKTIWHLSAEKKSIRILRVLTELDERDQGLQMVSLMQETPIGITLMEGYRESTLFLLKHCNSAECFKSPVSLFRAAAKLGSPEVIQKLIDVGIELDGIDDRTGNPLHFLRSNPNPECIRILAGLFSLHQRRQEDDKTPLELILSKGVSRENGLHKDACDALFADLSIYSHAREATTLWEFVCSNIMPSAVRCSNDLTWLTDLLFRLIQLGIIKLYEEETKSSAIIPFASWAFRDLEMGIPLITSGSFPFNYITQWEWISNIIQQLVQQTQFWEKAATDLSMVAFLSESIIHGDGTMITLLLESGVDVHTRVERLSPLELACFPAAKIDEVNFRHLLMKARTDLLFQGNEAFQGRGVVHFTAGSARVRGSEAQLKCLLQAGVDVNAQAVGGCDTPLLYHADCNSFNTVDILLKFGADPWLAGPDTFDAPLRAIMVGNLAMLDMTAAFEKEKSLSPLWNRTWKAFWHGKLFSGGNALHLAAAFGQTQCLEFYLNQGLLRNLDATDDDLETPMHYAARFGMGGTINFLHGLGANLNAMSRHGLTPLHLAAMMQQLDATQTLVRLDAKQIPCASGRVPLVYAYKAGNPGIIGALETSQSRAQNDSSMTNPKGLRMMADILAASIRRDDITACRSIISLGCPADIELNDPPGIYPLMVAISEQKSLEIVNLLLQNDALVSAVCPGEFSTALEAAAARPAFNTMLSSLTTQYFDEGGDFLVLPRNPLHVAVTHQNLAGLYILLDVLSQRYFGGKPAMEQRMSTAGIESSLITAIINQKDAINGNATLLHQASIGNNVRLAQGLIDKLASIEPLDNEGKTPLHFAALHGSTGVAKLLLDHGASPNMRDNHEMTPFMTACAGNTWEMVQLLSQIGGHGMIAGYCEHTPLTYMLSVHANSPQCNPDIRIFNLLVGEGAELHKANLGGQTAIHHLLCSPSQVHLRSLLNKDARLLVPQSEWPRSHFGCYSEPSKNLIAATRNFRVMSHYLDEKELRHTADLRTPGTHNLLCTAACWGVVEAIQHFLAIGAHLEHRCVEHGSLLAAAASHRKTKAVKWLIRQGVRLNFEGANGSAARGITVADCGWPIMHWLLATRYTEQPKIGYPAWKERDEQISNWAGVSTVRVPLRWEWRPRRGETMLEYAKRRQGIISKLRGTVLFA